MSALPNPKGLLFQLILDGRTPHGMDQHEWQQLVDLVEALPVMDGVLPVAPRWAAEQG